MYIMHYLNNLFKNRKTTPILCTLWPVRTWKEACSINKIMLLAPLQLKWGWMHQGSLRHRARCNHIDCIGLQQALLILTELEESLWSKAGDGAGVIWQILLWNISLECLQCFVHEANFSVLQVFFCFCFHRNPWYDKNKYIHAYKRPMQRQ